MGEVECRSHSSFPGGQSLSGEMNWRMDSGAGQPDEHVDRVDQIVPELGLAERRAGEPRAIDGCVVRRHGTDCQRFQEARSRERTC